MSAVVESLLALGVGLCVAIAVQTIPHRSAHDRPRIGHHADVKP